MKMTVKRLREHIRSRLDEMLGSTRRSVPGKPGHHVVGQRAPSHNWGPKPGIPGHGQAGMAHAGPRADDRGKYHDPSWGVDTFDPNHPDHQDFVAAWPEEEPWLYGVEEPLPDPMYDMDDVADDDEELELDPREMGWRPDR
jgi:hypothetical protein